jgi:hypothetical protein
LNRFIFFAKQFIPTRSLGVVYIPARSLGMVFLPLSNYQVKARVNSKLGSKGRLTAHSIRLLHQVKITWFEMTNFKKSLCPWYPNVFCELWHPTVFGAVWLIILTFRPATIFWQVTRNQEQIASPSLRSGLGQKAPRNDIEMEQPSIPPKYGFKPYKNTL